MKQETREALLALYDAPDPTRGGLPGRGYDRDHADRTSRILMLTVRDLGLDPSWYDDLEATALLHDIGRAGMDPELFGKVFGLAQELGLPLRVGELRSRYPHVAEAHAAEFFLDLIGPSLAQRGVPVDERVREHVRMRMDFDRRLREMLAERAPVLKKHGITVKPWMEKVMLYYYYPERMQGEREDVRLMGMALVACENFEAYNNRRRGRDYYGRTEESLRDVFEALERFEANGLVAPPVLDALRRLAASGELDGVVKESRGLDLERPLPEEDLSFQQELLAPAS